MDLIPKALRAMTTDHPDEDVEIVVRKTRRERNVKIDEAKTDSALQASVNRGKATLRKPTSSPAPSTN